MKRWWKKFVVCGGLVAAVIASSTSAGAQSPLEWRMSHILIGGSFVQGTGAQGRSPQECTLGVVLTKDGFWRQIWQYHRSMRYGITAAHCTHVSNTILGENYSDVGRTIAIYEQNDLALVQIFPIPRHDCTWIYHGGSEGGRHCVPTTTWVPRAAGKVFMSPRFGADLDRLPVTEVGNLGNGENFCISGALGGVNCSFITAPFPPHWVDHIVPPARFAFTNGRNAEPGDSGSPITNRQGTFFGIQNGIGHSNETRGYLVWTPASVIFQHFPGYSLAPTS
ncbi:hypothetical protein [Rathayibacter toxicus]|uniref:hypothetical protein n=1 Tax=Rathayibacter toxicus TaxID=145458 RepID=UPI0011B0017D|nr:hypothetical protein [Rathayibacter toxicus]QOD09661.1 hypothetical protein BSG36_06720 [Rathayibacter toxicus]QWL28327.1 hypothetical protein E2R33_06725 [Rathayibacter toxicus]